MLWTVFKKAWISILVLVMVAMLVAGLVTNYLVVKKYSSSVTFYVINVSPDSEYITTSLTQVIGHLSNDYIQIIQSEVLMSPLCEFLMTEYNIEYTPNQIRKMISTSVNTDSSTFSLKVTNSDVNHAYIIAQYIAYEAPKIVKDYTSISSFIDSSEKEDTSEHIEKMRVLNNPKPDDKPDSPSLFKNLVISATLTAILVYAIFFLRSMFNTVITTEEDIKDITKKYPVIGTIPRWE
jgi:capsular polysaccharide biosynthesis protein